MCKVIPDHLTIFHNETDALQFGDIGEVRFGYLDMRAELGHFVEVMELGQPVARWLAQIDAAAAA